MQNKKVLVTGGAGFIGSHLVDELLNRKYNVVVVDNFLRGNKLPRETIDKITLIKGDVKDPKVMDIHAKDCEIIFHFAAYLGVDIVAENPVETMIVESLGMQNVVAAAIKNSVKKIIYASTSGVYGKTAIEKSVSEDFIVDPRSSYSIAKRFNEIFLQSYWIENKIESVSLRYFNVYGERQDNRMVIPKFFDQTLENKPITVYGTGSQTRDFTYVKDVVKATCLIAENVKGCEIFNICGTNEFSIFNLAKLIKKFTNSNSKISKIDLPKGRYDFEVERRSGDSTKLFKHIKYRPDTSLEEGLNKILKTYKNIKDE